MEDGIHIELGEHIALIGTTGSGKTEFFKRVLMPETKRLLIVDTEDRQFGDIDPIQLADGMKDAAAKVVALARG